MHASSELLGQWFLCVQREGSRHGPFDLLKYCFEGSGWGALPMALCICLCLLVLQEPCYLRPMGYSVPVPCSLDGSHGSLPPPAAAWAGEKERWKAKPSYSCQWTKVSARRWPVASDKPGCQPWWLLAPLDAEWYLPDTRGQAGRRKGTG